MVLEANGFKAVTSTAGARAFKKEWAKEFENVPEVYICFDNDEAGKAGALRVGRLIPHAKIVDLPEEVGQGGDVTDFFVQLRTNPRGFSKPSKGSQAGATATRARSPSLCSKDPQIRFR